MAITVQEFRSLFTQKLIARVDERLEVPTFFRSMARVDEADTKNVSIEVRRGVALKSEDKRRGDDPNLNTFGDSTQKIFTPPYYPESIRLNEMEAYDRVFGSADAPIDERAAAAFLNQVDFQLEAIQNKIERSYENQWAQVFQSGVVTIDSDTDINFRRKATSMVNTNTSSNGYWNTANATIVEDLQTGCDFLNEEGKISQTTEIMGIFGGDALRTILQNDEIQKILNFRRADLIDIQQPSINGTGGKFHGRITVGGYNVQIWSYNGFYESRSGNTITRTRYWPQNRVLLTVETAEFIQAFGAVPQLRDVSDMGIANFGQAIPLQSGQYVISTVVDERATSHELIVRSAGLAVPVDINQFYTLQVLA